MMRISLAMIGFLVWLTLPASAQGQCFPGPGPDGRPLSFQQWYGVCRAQVGQVCETMSGIMGGAAQPGQCQAIMNSYYQQYVSSVISVGGQPQCSQFNAGQMACINGWLATCNGTLWQRSANTCGGY
jgi:hypothetical protein